MEVHMILSTLPAVPGRDFEIRGLVLAEGRTVEVGIKALDKMIKARAERPNSVSMAMQAIAQQAAQLGANAVVDVKVIRLSDSGWVVTGTAEVIQD
jgi:uncharacterized protein YbjQ (UPF0145 family)